LEGKTSLLVFADSKLPNGFAVRLVILICEANCVYCKAIHTRNEIPIYNLSEVKTSFIVFTDSNLSEEKQALLFLPMVINRRALPFGLLH
jgi:hypothetical protein